MQNLKNNKFYIAKNLDSQIEIFSKLKHREGERALNELSIEL